MATKKTVIEIIETNDGKFWRRNGELHRDDGPAIERPNGTKEWWRNDRIHRDDGPAIEYADGAKWWYRDGKLHRDDGPAIEWADGTREWYRNNKRMSQPEFSNAAGLAKNFNDTLALQTRLIELEARVQKLEGTPQPVRPAAPSGPPPSPH